MGSSSSDEGVSYHTGRIEAFIRRGERIQLVLPAFPAKSSNPEKTLGILPDYGEVLALARLDRLCVQIQAVYEPGAELVICSDGRVFSDLVQVADEAVSAYTAEIQRIIDANGFSRLSTYNLDDLFPAGTGHDETRWALAETYGEPIPVLRERIAQDPDTRQLYNGIHRFLFEDLVVLHPELSRTKVRNWSGELAYQVIQRSNAWSNLVAERFPEAVRLSIHPQPLHSRKIGVRLVPSNNIWRTPWHSAVLFDGSRFSLVRRADAERMGARLVRSGGFAYFEALNPMPVQRGMADVVLA